MILSNNLQFYQNWVCQQAIWGPLNVLVSKNLPETNSKPKTQKSASKKPKETKSTQSKSKASQSGTTAKSTSQDNQIETDNNINSVGNEPTGGNGNGRSKTQAAGNQPAMSEAQKRAIYKLSRRRGISVEDLEQMALDAYGLSVENLTSKDASAFIRNLQQAA